MTGSRTVLDASALLALLRGETGAEAVEELAEDALISAVNWSEVWARSLAAGIDTAGLREDVEALGIRIEPFAARDAEDAGELWPGTRAAGLSLGDRACLALARRHGATALTADRSWLDLDLGVDVRAIR